VVDLVVVAVVVAVVVVHILVAAVVVAVMVAGVVLMMAAVVVVSVVAVVVVDVVAAWLATSASGSASSSATASASTLSCFRVFGIILGVFDSCSFFSISWSIGFGIFFIFSISGIGGILRCIVIWRFLLLSFVTSCRSISFWAIASGVSWFCSVIGCILVSRHVGD